MANPFSKGWKYLVQSLDTKIDEKADPKIQIQQATEAAKKQHARITEAAAAVIGNRNQLEMKLHRLQEDQSKLADSARQALQQADAAAAAGDHAKAGQLNQTAEVFATQLVSVEQQLEDTKKSYVAAVEGAKQAEQQQKQSALRLQEQLSQIDQLRAQVEQTKMQEATAKSMQRMDGMQALANENVPSLDAVRDKIEKRYATALGAQELAENSVNGRMAEIAQSTQDFKASSRLEQIRAELAGKRAALEQGDGGRSALEPGSSE